VWNFTVHNEPIFKNSVVLAPAPAPYAFTEHIGMPAEYVDRPPLSKELNTSAWRNVEVLPAFSIPYATAPSSSSGLYSSSSPDFCHFTAPEIPMLLMPTHVEVLNLPLRDLAMRMDFCLKNIAGVSFVQSNFEVYACVGAFP
jgi:hypothetical protein